MLAFHNSLAIKERYLARVQEHETTGAIVQGHVPYWKDGKACAVGATIHSKQHALYEAELGIPVLIARFEDRIFEGMSKAQFRTFPRRFLEAIAPGADLTNIWPAFAPWLLTKGPYAVSQYADSPHLSELIRLVSGLYQDNCRDADLWREAVHFKLPETAFSYVAIRAKQAVQAAAWAGYSPQFVNGWAPNALDLVASAAWHERRAAYDAMAEEFLRLLAQA